ncbi:MAG: DUF1622 domain-containing protein [Methanoregulaceae archaeon]|nr:DUF1622 domain-containing protein [Methanoregulaceae archaeon]
MEFIVYTDIIEILAFFFSVVGAVLIGYGGITAAYKVFLREVFKRPFGYNLIRREFTSKIVFGLEFFIASDVLRYSFSP